jgi:hypothetical protein
MSQRTSLHHPYLTLLILGVAGGASGCEDPLTDPSVIAGPRIVGARVVSAAAPSVAEPAAGQAASIDWLAVSNEPGTFRAHVVWCKAAPTLLGAPRCDGSAFAEQTASGSWGVPISLGFDVPGELAPGSAWLSWLGICSLGEATFDPSASTFACPEGEPLSGFYRGFIPEGTPNENPSLADDRLVLDGAPWPALGTAPEQAPMPSEPGAPCAGLGLPVLRAEQLSSVEFELGGDDREALENAPDTYAAHPRESLVYTHLASLPGLDRAFSAIDYDAQRLGFDVSYEFAEEPPGQGGITLAFILLVRDERGGVDWLQRQACLLPQ